MALERSGASREVSDGRNVAASVAHKCPERSQRKFVIKLVGNDDAMLGERRRLDRLGIVGPDFRPSCSR
jgi:hypothetical protein